MDFRGGLYSLYKKAHGINIPEAEGATPKPVKKKRSLLSKMTSGSFFDKTRKAKESAMEEALK